MFELHWCTFEEWIIKEADCDTDDLEFVAFFLEYLSNLSKSFVQRDLQTSSELYSKILALEDRLIQLIIKCHEACCSSAFSKLRLMYMDMVQILKKYFHSECAGLWD